MQRQDGLSIKQDDIPYNVYSNPKSQLPISILDRLTVDVGKYLIQKYLCTSGLFQCSKNDTPSMQDLTGPKQLLQKKVKSSKVSQSREYLLLTHRLQNQRKNELNKKRRTAVKRETKKIDCISSEMNACQAILKPDCSKPKVLKSTDIQKAIIQLTAKSLCMLDGHLQEEIQDNGIIKIAENVLPDSMRSEVKLATVELAGVKFKAKVFSGDDYLDFVKNYVIQKTINQMPNISRMVICEEKYHFTPDDFKAATRAQRTSSANVGISHLKTVDEMISANRFDKASLVSTTEGKSFISTYLARRIDELHLYMNLTLIIDSEFYKEDGCTTPVECLLGKKEGLKSKTKMVNIKQRKGEAEMAQLDWLLEFADKLEQGDGCASIVTSGDIDAVVIHLFTLSFLWPRSQDGTFKNDVYVVLQKAGSLMDIYNITKIIEILEKAWKEKYVAANVAIALSLGGNDFCPNFIILHIQRP
ncbi:unnamed protein product [Mytilus coruscus]|uniref:Uncharacterized protein n=1 Tax=Mytilus coruscus TaxID=42192 RepID=A0A6J8BXW7_MYTCO|nr:unnamed protein product [Mytilus coruscus]